MNNNDNQNSSGIYCGRYKVKHILIAVKVTDNMSTEEKENASATAKATAEKIIYKLQTGDSWTGLLKKYTDDKKSILYDGIIKNFTRGNVPDELFSVVEKMVDGRIYPRPVYCQDGYHVIQRICSMGDDSSKEEQVEEEETKEEPIDISEEYSSTEKEEKNKTGKSSKSGDSKYESEVSSNTTLNQQIRTESIVGENIQQSIVGNRMGPSAAEVELHKRYKKETNAELATTVDSSVNTNASVMLNNGQKVQPAPAPAPNFAGRNQRLEGTSTLDSEVEMTSENSILLDHNSQINEQEEGTISTPVSFSVSSHDVTVGRRTPGTGGAVNPNSNKEKKNHDLNATTGEEPHNQNLEEKEVPDEMDPTEGMEPDDIEPTDDDMFSEENPDQDSEDSDQRGSTPSFPNQSPSQVNHRNGNLSPNLGAKTDDSAMLRSALNRGQANNLPKLNANNREQEEDGAEEGKSKLDAVQEKIAEKGLSMAAQSFGVPKPLADAAASKVAGPLLQAQKRKIRMIIAIIVSIIIIFLVLLFSLMNRDVAEGSIAERGEYLYYGGSDEQLYEYLVQMGYCHDLDSCGDSDAATFYKTLRNLLDSNQNLTKGEADIFIMKIISYGRSDDATFAAYSEIQPIADIITANGKFLLENVEQYKDGFINDGGYLITYRQDLLKNDVSLAKRESIYQKMVDSTTSAAQFYNYEERNPTNTGAAAICTQITVTGNLAGTYDFEEYVAKVVTRENDWVPPNGSLANNMAQAVAARTYALRQTNDCQSPIENSTRKQTMAETASENAIASANQTARQVLLDSDGKYYSTMYDALCYTSVDANNYTLCQAGVKVPRTWLESHLSARSIAWYQEHKHGQGMSQWGARYLASIGYSYEDILSTFYGDATLTTLAAISEGLEPAVSNPNFYKRSSRALRDNDYFYNDGAFNEGECAWYAVRRTNEILAMIGSTTRVTSGGNGRDFCRSADYSGFRKVYDINELKAGMVISWEGGSHGYGHVAIIEDVSYAPGGETVLAIVVSEGSNSSGTGYNTTYKGNYINNQYIWSLDNGPYKKEVRQYNCEGSLNGSTGTGCQRTTTIPVSKIRNRWAGYNFVCGIDLLS